MRAFALGGVLQILRASKGWSVEQAAVHAGLGHMTWRRMEDGFSVRAKTYAAVDQLFELPFGTVKRALNDDLLMVQLIARVGVETKDVTTATAPDFVERFAKQTLSKTAKSTVQARAGFAGSPTRRPVEAPVAARPAAVSDLELAAQLLDRVTRRELTPRLETAVRALLDAMPDLIAHNAAEHPPAAD